MANIETRNIYGQTGKVGKDGLLSVDQQVLLNQLQEKAASITLNYLYSRQPEEPFPMVAMATGIGKGNIIHRVIERTVRENPDAGILVIAGTKIVLVDQTHEALGRYSGQYVESENEDELTEDTSSLEENPLSEENSFLYRTGSIRQATNVHVATIQTIQSEMAKGTIMPEDYDLVIVDEVHNIGTARRKAVAEQFENVIGFTATPFRHTGRMKSPEEYGFKVVESLTLPEAQELRLLPPLVGMQIDTKDVVDEIPTTKTGLIDYKKLEKVLKDSPDLRPYIADRISEIISARGRKYKTVIAVNFVWEAQELAELLNEKGIKVGVAVNQRAAKEIDTQKIPAIDSIERYKLPASNKNSIQVLISPYVASEGFDAPFTEVLVWASPTDSALRYTQYTGRLARRAEGKMFGVVIDCLYQTNQYNWSYNMGMWMKGDVVQLDNGLLYLGPEQDISSLSRTLSIKNISGQSDRTSLKSLQEEGLMEIQNTDAVLTAAWLRERFVGTPMKLKQLAEEIAADLRKTNSDMVATRINNTHYDTVVTDSDLFFKLMKNKGVVPRSEDLSAPKDTDAILSTNWLRDNFIGNYATLKPLADSVLRQLQSSDETRHLINRRRFSGNVVTVVTDVELFKKLMLESGARPKAEDTTDVLGSEAIISARWIQETFIGDYRKLIPVANEVIESLQRSKKNARFVVQKRISNNYVTTVTDRALFIRLMQEKGIRVKEEVVEDMRDTDYQISPKALKDIFKGEHSKLVELSEKAVKELQEKYPDSVKSRYTINRARVVSVITNPKAYDAFIDIMKAQGLRLKA